MMYKHIYKLYNMYKIVIVAILNLPFSMLKSLFFDAKKTDFSGYKKTPT